MESVKDTIISLEEAVAYILEEVQPITETEEVTIMDALHRIAAENIYAAIAQPPFSRAPVDGYAVRAADTEGADDQRPVSLEVTDEIHAGSISEKTLEAGQAARIMTGAAIPNGADCTIRQEDTDYGEDTVLIYRQAEPYENYCFAGEDYQAGTCLIRKEEKIDAAAVGLLASMGLVKVRVYRKIRVAVFTTGDELILPGQPLLPGKIFNTNLFVIKSRLEELGIQPIFIKGLPDREIYTASMIKTVSREADVIVTTGGVSVGKRDIMHNVIERLEARRLFWKVACKPGTPVLCSKYQNTLIISLSGNPFGAVTNLEVLVRPALARITRDESLLPKSMKAVMNSEFSKTSPMRRFLRAEYKDGEVYLPQAGHSAGVLSSMRGCNCIVDIPAGTEKICAGEEVWIRFL